MSFHLQGLLPDVVPHRHRSDHVANPSGNAVRHDAAWQELPVAVLPWLVAHVAVAGFGGIPDEVRRQWSTAKVLQANLPAAMALPENQHRPDTGSGGAARIAYRWQSRELRGSVAILKRFQQGGMLSFLQYGKICNRNCELPTLIRYFSTFEFPKPSRILCLLVLMNRKISIWTPWNARARIS